MVQCRALFFSNPLPCTAESNLYTAQNYGAEASSNTQEKSKIFESIQSVQKNAQERMHEEKKSADCKSDVCQSSPCSQEEKKTC